MSNTQNSGTEKLSKIAKKEQKKLEKASERIEKQLEEKSYLKLSIFIVFIVDLLIFAGVLLLTSSIFGILMVYGYVILITFIALVPMTVEEYMRVGRKPNAIIRFANWFLEKVLPFNRQKMKIGPSILIIFTYLISLGGFIAISIFIFADFLSQNHDIYDYLIAGSPSGQYGFFSFVNNASANSLVPAILWALIIFIPVLFCFLFLIATFYYRNNEPARLLNIIIVSPIIVLIPLFLTASAIICPSIIIALIFISAWVITLLIWYRFTKRTALICLSILFTQVLASFLIIYNFVFIEVRDTSVYLSDSIDTSSYYNPLFLVIWFGVLVFIPLITKGFDILLKGKLKIMGIIIAIGLAVTFQYNFFNRFSNAIYTAYEPFLNQDAAEVFVGSGFFFFYIYLILIPLFFIFGYFQIGIARSLYRSFRDFGKKCNQLTLFRVLGGLLSTLFIISIIFVYYFFLYTPTDYQNMFSQAISLYNGDLIKFLTNPSLISIPPFDQLFQVSSLAITIGLLAYSSYSGAYNLSLSADKVLEPDIKRFGVFNFVIFTSPSAYKTRIIFARSLVFVFLGITAIFAFLKIHTILFPSTTSSLVIFAIFNGLKLLVSIIGLSVAIIIFFSILYRQRNLK